MTTFYGTDVNDTVGATGTGEEYNSYYGGLGDDYLRTSPTTFGTIRLEGGAGNDLLDMEESVIGQDGNLYGGDGEDFVIGSLGTDYLYGGLGDDLLLGSIPFSFQPGAGIAFLGGSIDSGIDILDGGQGRDGLYGFNGNDFLYGGEGNDSGSISFVTSGGGGNTAGAAGLYGGAGDDFLDGGTGNDRLDGGADNDTLVGGTGNDTLLGGSGNDLIITSTLIAAGLPGAGGVSTANGGDGNDKIISNGADVVNGGNGIDLLFKASDNVANFSGDAGADTLLGGSGNDQLFGGADGDILQGKFGFDSFTGGSGNDYFVMKNDIHVSDRDTIKDYTYGQDHIGLPTYMQNHISVTDTLGGVDIHFVIGGGAYDILVSNTHNVAQVQAGIYYAGA
jgi:Ca2+-binding RTX toxin-like protein